MDAIKNFADFLAKKAANTAKEIIEKNGVSAEYAFGSVVTENRYFKITVMVDDLEISLPIIDFSESFKAGTWEAEINDFFESSGKFIAYEFLLTKGINLNEQHGKETNKSGNDTRKRRGRPAKRNIKSN